MNTAATTTLNWKDGEVIAVSLQIPGVDFRTLSLNSLDEVAAEAHLQIRAAGINPPPFKSTPAVYKDDSSILILAD